MKTTMWTPTVMMLGASLISYVDRNTLAVLAPMILADTKMTARDYGFAISCFSIAYMVANPLWGFILDRKGLRIGMAFAVILWSLASFAHALVGVVAWFVLPMQFAIARLFLGLGEGATFPGAMRTVGVTLPQNQQGKGIAIAYSGGSLGAVLTPLLVTPIALVYGWRAAFWATGLAGLVWVAAWVASTRTWPLLLERPARAAAMSFRNMRDGRFWAFVILYSFGALPLAVGIYAAPLFLSSALNVSQATLGYWLWLPPLGWELGYLFWGWFMDRSGRRFGQVASVLALASGALALIPLVGSAGPVLILFFLSMFAAGGFVILALKYGLAAYPYDKALLAGIGAGAWSLLVAILMPWVGALFDAERYTVVFLVVAGVPALGAIIWAWLDRVSAPSHQRDTVLTSNPLL